MTEELKAEKGDWSDFSNEKKTTTTNSKFRKAEFMKLDQPGTYMVRLVGTHVKFRRHWNPIRALTHDALKDQDPAWKAGFFPKRRYAINVIDKTGIEKGETGTLKIMEQGKTIFEAFSLYKETTGIDPTGKDGPNFAIRVDIPTDDKGRLDRLHTTYGVVPLNAAPFTDAEKKLLCKTDEEGNILKDENGKPVSNLYPLSKIFKPDSVEKMMELWDALPDEKKIAPKREDKKFKNSNTESKKQPEPITEGEITEEPISTVNASSEELFSENEGSDNTDDSTDLF